MRIDLHCHSTCSDGSLPPAEVGARARAAGVEVFCLTDHDTCAGSDDAAREFGSGRALRGVELSCRERGKTVHLLLYDVAGDERWDAVEEVLKTQRQARRKRVLTIAARLEQRGLAVDADKILADNPGSVGRPAIADAMVAAGHVRSRAEAFRHYLYDGGLADVPIARVDVEQGVALAKSAGARVSLAHPHQLGGDATALVRDFRGHGLEGIEAFYQLYTRKQRRIWLELAARYGLVATGGSDFHGAGFEAVSDFGVDIPEPHARALRDWLAQ